MDYSNIYVDPGELKSNSSFEKSIKLHPDYNNFAEQFSILPGLEAKTGADMMISHGNLPWPKNDILLRRHIKKGAFLVQLKFGHDLIKSIIDGRYKEAQSRMKLIGAKPWQRILLFIGYAGYDNEDNLLINNQKTLGAKNFKYPHLLSAKSFWNCRGGNFQEISKRVDLLTWIQSQMSVLETIKESPQKNAYPVSPQLYEEELVLMDNASFIERELLSAQNLTLIKDCRILFNTLPGIGPKTIEAIWSYLDDSKHPQSWYGLMDILSNGELLKIKGIGKKSVENIKNFLEKNTT